MINHHWSQGTPSPDDKGKGKNSDQEDNVSLPPIEEKRKNKQAKEDQDKDEYSEQDAIMDAEELHTAIEGNIRADRQTYR